MRRLLEIELNGISYIVAISQNEMAGGFCVYVNHEAFGMPTLQRSISNWDDFFQLIEEYSGFRFKDFQRWRLKNVILRDHSLSLPWIHSNSPDTGSIELSIAV